MGIVSWKLWRALHRPPRRHPLFQYVLTHADRSERRVTSGFFMWAFMISSLLFFWVIVFEWVFYLLLVAMIAVNMIYGLRWAVRISKTIIEEKADNRFDLLASLPLGGLGTSWAISLGCVHRRPSFRVMPYLILLTAFVTAGMLIFVSSTTAIILDNVSINEQTLLQNINIMYLALLGIPLMVIFYIDHLYSIITAILVGQLVTVDKRHIAEGQVQSGLLFLMLQLLLYMVSVVLAILVFPFLIGLVALSEPVSLFLTTLLTVTTYVTLREWLVTQLWRNLHNVFDADEKEISLVLNGREVDALSF